MDSYSVGVKASVEKKGMTLRKGFQSRMKALFSPPFFFATHTNRLDTLEMKEKSYLFVPYGLLFRGCFGKAL